jgi:ubiquinone/menaquinone biosynthesis C-methylase UbiE
MTDESREGQDRLGSDAMAKPEDTATDEILREWGESAPYWQRHADTIRSMFGPVTQALIEAANIMEGETVLDVAGGAGEPSLTIAEVVGPTGSVTYTDAVREMVAAAESEARRRGLSNVSFKQSSAQSLPFESQSFDAVTSRLGVMFFPDPGAALREMLRVTKHEGVMALAVWGKSELNPFSYSVTNVVSRYLNLPPADPSVPNAFRFAEPGALAAILLEAGGRDVKERVIDFHINAPISQKEFWEMRSETSGTLREKLAALPDDQAASVAAEVQKAVSVFFPNNEMNFPAQMIIVTGQKSIIGKGQFWHC